METALNIASIVVIVFGILQIILFFKTWGMTNNVAIIKKSLPNTETDLSEARLEFIIGNIDKAKDLAKREFVVDVFQIYKKTVNGRIFKGEYDTYFNSIENKYRKAFENASTFIKFEDFSSFDKAAKIFH